MRTAAEVRRQMDSAEWYHGRAGGPLWDVCSQVYIETTERSCIHLASDKVTRTGRGRQDNSWKPHGCGADDAATGPPYMQVTIEDVIVHCGETAQFDAVIDGSPPLTIAWYKDNSPLKESDRIQMVKEDRKYSLVLRSAKRGDGGVYTCTASNSAGEVSCKAELIMHEDEREQDTKTMHKRRKLKSFFEVKDEIGRGCFSFVKRVVHKGNGATCAAKFIPLRSKTRQQAHRERDILSEVSHSRVTKLLDAFETKKTLILILELCCGEEILDRLYRKHTFTEKEVKLYIRQLLEAIAYLHSRNILHLDIKPSNILMVSSDKEEIKLCDFGFAQKVSASAFQYSKYGSPEFVSPEIAGQAPVSKSSDIWPVGVISYVCLLSVSPFAGQNDRETLLNVQQGKISWTCPGFAQLSANAQDFMKLTIQMSPDARPGATDCIQHKWFVESSSPEDTQPISSKNLRFLVARSRWQRSLMCYKSILVMRSIPELLNSKMESTSLGVPRHLVECSSSSSSSGSSSDNESDASPTARDCNPSLELHLSIFKMSEKDRLEPQSTPEPEMEREVKDTVGEEKRESKDITLHGLHDTSSTYKQEHESSGLCDNQEELGEAEKMLISSVETSPRKQPLNRAATIEVGGLASKKAKTGSFVRGTSADSALLLQRGIDKPSLVCVPRQSIINSMFYNQACEGPGTASSDEPFKEKEFVKHRERARRSLMKAGYSQKILSGLREPLLEQFAMEQRMLAQDGSTLDQDGQLSALKKSASFDTVKGPLRSSFKVSSRSRSLDDYKSRPLSVYKGTFVEEVNQDHSKGAKGAIDTFVTDTKHQAERLLIADGSTRVTSAPPEFHQHSAAAKISSTRRPLSAPPIGRDNTIIAVLHQQSLLDAVGTKEGSTSAMLEGDEGTIIAFVKPKQMEESESFSKPPSAVVYDIDKMRRSPHSAELVTEGKGQLLDIKGGVKLTVHATSHENDFLTSDNSAKKSTDGVKYSEDFAKDKQRKEDIFLGSTTEKPLHFAQFSDENTRIAVIHQSTGEVLSLSKHIAVHVEDEKHPDEIIQPMSSPTSDFPTQITAATGPSGDINIPDTIMTELSLSGCSTERFTVTQSDVADKLKPFIHQKTEFSKDYQKEIFPSQKSEYDTQVPLPKVHCHETSRSDSRQSFTKDLQFSEYGDEQCVTLEDLVGEMSSLSEEMEVLASEQKLICQGDLPFPPVTDQSMEPTEPQKSGSLTGEFHAMETDPSPFGQIGKEPQITSISQCSFYESLSRAHVSPPHHEHFEEFTIESRSSSKTFISHSDSSGTGQRSDNFSDFEEAGRHSEVSLVEIGEIHQKRSSTSCEPLALGTYDFETTRSQLQDLYDLFSFPQQPLSIEENKFSSLAEQCGQSSVESQHAMDFGETVMATSTVRPVVEVKNIVPLQPLQPSDPKERKSSRKRIKLFRPHGKPEKTGKTTEPSLKQKVKASVANISRIIKGKHGNGKEGPSDVAKLHIAEQTAASNSSGPVKKKGLPSFKLLNLSAKDKAPAFVEELTDQTVVVGHMVTLTCRTAQPVSDVAWYKDGVAIHSSERVLISSTLKNYHLLTILVVNAQDFGIYACVATNVLGSASTCCIIKKAEIPCCPSSPDVAQVYKDGALIVWKPVESSTPVTYFLQYRKEGEEWRALTLDISDCCYSTHNLSEGHVYSFRIACISKAGMGPYSNPSVGVRIGRSSPANVHLSGLPRAGERDQTSERELTTDLQVEGKRGRFSNVRLCTEKSTGRALAAKIIPYVEEQKEATLLEYHILKKLHHTNLVQLHAAFLSPQHLVLVLELCEGQELLRCLSSGPSYSELEVRDYLWQILSAVEFLHDKQILHLDLRSENTIVTEHKLVKILDFGSAQVYSPDKVITPQRYTDYFETMAPELVEGQGAVPPTDIWAVGITAFIMLSGDYPFSSDSGTELEKGMKKGLIRFSRCYAGLSGGAVRFLQSTLWANPWGRPSASDCLKMPWLQEAGLATLQEPPVSFPSERLRDFLRQRSKTGRVAQSALSPPVQLSHS
ncbi:obscurin-like [Pseudophryne corroboree]|uniref:obscurin-like n=1 Tax=Pseudophryne corroboree TaxID=495146 RepID=UPI003081A9C4